MMAPRTVAYAGSEGGFAHAAARKHFGASATFRSAPSVGAVLEEVTRGRASGGVVPLETSTDGAVTATLHGLVQADVKICAELTMPQSYHLASETGNASDIEKIYGATHAVAACERFLRERFPRATVLDVPSADVAAQFAKEDHGAAAIATDIVVPSHDLRIIHERIEDVTGVETRFAVVGHDLPPRTGTDRTVLAMAVGDGPGSLHRSLQPFADRSINLTRLESRPSHGTAWRHVFFVELDGHVTDRPVLTCIEDVRAVSRMVKVLGSYPRPI
jgi:chorismate mutase/prephenate dehydratase